MVHSVIELVGLMLIVGEYGGLLGGLEVMGMVRGVSRGFEVGMGVVRGLILGIRLLLLVVPPHQLSFASLVKREGENICEERLHLRRRLRDLPQP